MEKLKKYFETEEHIEMVARQNENIIWNRLTRTEDKLNEMIDWINKQYTAQNISEVLNCCKAMIDQKMNVHEDKK